MSIYKSIQSMSLGSEGGGGKKKDEKNTQDCEDGDGGASQKDGASNKGKEKEEDTQEGIGYGIHDYDFGDCGSNFVIFEDPEAAISLEGRNPIMPMRPPPATLGKRTREDSGDECEDHSQDRNGDENKENIGTSRYRRPPQQSCAHSSNQTCRKCTTRRPLGTLHQISPEWKNAENCVGTTKDPHKEAQLAYGLSLKEKEAEYRRQLYLATIEANKVLAELAEKKTKQESQWRF